MRFTYAAIASLLGAVAVSQIISDKVAQLPSCSLGCLTTAISEVGCGLTDYACQCGPVKADITTSISQCLQKACSPSDSLSVLRITSEICSIQGRSGRSSPVTSSPAGKHYELRAAPTEVSAIGSVATGSFATGSFTAGSFATTATSAGVSTPSSTASKSAPATVSTSSGDRLHLGDIWAGAGALFALIL